MPILVQPWPPVDPNEERTQVEFSAAWAKRLRGFHTLADIQAAAGTKGAITERDKGTGSQFASYHWMSVPKNGRPGGFMLAREYADGSIGVGILSNDAGQIVVNSAGAFVCDRCNPPIDERGSEPAWSRY